MPFFIAFSEGALDEEWYRVQEITIDVIFTVDMLLIFRTSYINVATGDEVFDPVLIAKNYLITGKFLLDAVSTFPFDLFADDLNANSHYLSLLSTLKIVRILRLNKILMYIRTRESVKLMIKLI